MADAGNTPAHETARLEAALDRIARFRPRGAARPLPDHSKADLARRLDALISDLRQVLGRDSTD